MEIIKTEVMLLAPIDRVWDHFTDPKHVVKWFFAMPRYKCSKAENDLREGGSFHYLMEAKDKSYGYELLGTIKEIEHKRRIVINLEGDRDAIVTLVPVDEQTTKFSLLFDPETKNTRETQKRFWELILSSFERYVEKE